MAAESESKAGRHRRPIAVRVGESQVLRFGRYRLQFGDPYHFVLTLSWPRFFVLLVVAFLAINLAFGFAYWVVDGSVVNAHAGSFFDCMFFSIETLATVGYGVMSPGSIYAHVVASIEILCGMVFLAIVTGLVFARFSRPTARILFSDRMVVGEFDGARALMVRIANERHNRIVEATARLTLIRNETAVGGERFVRIRDLPLMRDRTPVFAMTWTLVHRIDADSPLFGWDPNQMAAAESRILLSVQGHDETMAATVYAGDAYRVEDIDYDSRYVDIIGSNDEGQSVIDLTRFHDTERIGEMKPPQAL
jgi:inward rectifier potassium channel